jgi:hypothetical protein
MDNEVGELDRLSGRDIDEFSALQTHPFTQKAIKFTDNCGSIPLY